MGEWLRLQIAGLAATISFLKLEQLELKSRYSDVNLRPKLRLRPNLDLKLKLRPKLKKPLELFSSRRLHLNKNCSVGTCKPGRRYFSYLKYHPLMFVLALSYG